MSEYLKAVQTRHTLYHGLCLVCSAKLLGQYSALLETAITCRSRPARSTHTFGQNTAFYTIKKGDQRMNEGRRMSKVKQLRGLLASCHSDKTQKAAAE